MAIPDLTPDLTPDPSDARLMNLQTLVVGSDGCGNEGCFHLPFVSLAIHPLQCNQPTFSLVPDWCASRRFLNPDDVFGAKARME